MSELHRRMAEAARALEPQYSTLEATLFEAEVRRRHREQQVRRRAVVVSGIVLVGLLTGWFILRPPASAGVPQVAIAEDASVVMPIGAPVRTVQAEPGLLWLELERASARFVVAPQHGRLVRVSAAGVQIEVVGTAFTVTRTESQVQVLVTEGKVRVRAGERESLLSAGDQGVFSAAPVGARAPLEVVEEDATEEVMAVVPEATTPRTPKRIVKRVNPAATWRALAEQGDFGTAWTALQQEGAPDDEPGDLLRAADVARLSGHPGASVVPLRRVLTQFGKDPRASLAAFTLGRVLLDDLGDPRGAAEAFLEAHALAPRSPLAPDALARAVEALARAGDTAAANTTALQFLRDFPQSGRVEAVRRWGGVSR